MELRHVKKELTHRDYEILADFRYAMRKFVRFSEEAAATVGLTPQQYQGLLAIRGFPDRTPMTIGDLAERLQMRPHTAVALVNRLVHQGQVVRQLATKDKRQVHVVLTDQGTAALERLAWMHREELQRLKVPLSELTDYLRGAE
jgi:DNA-binding MarR family transcriptional regulator